MDRRWTGARLIERDGTKRISIGAREMTVTQAAEAAGLPVARSVRGYGMAGRSLMPWRNRWTHVVPNVARNRAGRKVIGNRDTRVT